MDCRQRSPSPVAHRCTDGSGRRRLAVPHVQGRHAMTDRSRSTTSTRARTTDHVLDSSWITHRTGTLVVAEPTRKAIRPPLRTTRVLVPASRPQVGRHVAGRSRERARGAPDLDAASASSVRPSWLRRSARSPVPPRTRRLSRRVDRTRARGTAGSSPPRPPHNCVKVKGNGERGTGRHDAPSVRAPQVRLAPRMGPAARPSPL